MTSLSPVTQALYSPSPVAQALYSPSPVASQASYSSSPATFSPAATNKKGSQFREALGANQGESSSRIDMLDSKPSQDESSSHIGMSDSKIRVIQKNACKEQYGFFGVGHRITSAYNGLKVIRIAPFLFANGARYWDHVPLTLDMTTAEKGALLVTTVTHKMARNTFGEDIVLMDDDNWLSLEELATFLKELKELTKATALNSDTQDLFSSATILRRKMVMVSRQLPVAIRMLT